MKTKQVRGKRSSTKLLLVLGSIAFLYVATLNFLAVRASVTYYDLGVILLTISPIAILVIVTLLRNPKLLFLSFIFSLPFIPSLGGYLNVIGGPFMVVSIEILAILGLMLANFETLQNMKLSYSMIIFIFLWLIGNSLSAILSINIFNSLPIYLLSVLTVIPWIFLLTAVTNPINNNEKPLSQTMLPVFCVSIAFFSLSTLVFLFLTDGINALNIASIIRPEIVGTGYSTNNNASGLALISLPITYALLKNSLINGKPSEILLYLLCILVPLFLILVDKSRAAILTTIFYSLILMFNQLSSFFQRRSTTKMSLGSKAILLLLISLAVFAMYLGFEAFMKRLAGSDTNFSPAQIIYRTLVSTRGAILAASWNEFLNYPLYGKGYGNNLIYIAEYGQYWNAHNMILEQLCATGIIGTFPVLYLLLASLRSWLKSRSRLDEINTLFANSIVLSIVGLLLFGFINGLELIAAYDIKSALPILILIMLIVILNRITNGENKLKAKS